MVDGSFRESVHALRFFGEQAWDRDDYEILWVEHYDSVSPELAAIADGVPNARIVTLGRDGVYHSSHCFNAGIAQARGELVLIPDGDVVVEPDFVARMWALHARNPRLVTYNYRFNEAREDHRDDVDIEHLKRVTTLTHPSNWGGCLGVRREWLLAVNGYEMLPLFATGDHGNDFDMYVRLKNLGLDVCWPREPVLYHPWHPTTLNFAYTHKLQAMLTQHRGHTLATLAHRGIDPRLDTDPPADVLAAIDQARAGFEAQGPAFEAPPAGRFAV